MVSCWSDKPKSWSPVIFHRTSSNFLRRDSRQGYRNIESLRLENYRGLCPRKTALGDNFAKNVSERGVSRRKRFSRDRVDCLVCNVNKLSFVNGSELFLEHAMGCSEHDLNNGEATSLEKHKVPRKRPHFQQTNGQDCNLWLLIWVRRDGHRPDGIFFGFSRHLIRRPLIHRSRLRISIFCSESWHTLLRDNGIHFCIDIHWHTLHPKMFKLLRQT